jgi:hypothetical protein
MKRNQVLKLLVGTSALAGCAPSSLVTGVSRSNDRSSSSRIISSRVTRGVSFPQRRPDGSFPATDHRSYHPKTVLHFDGSARTTHIVGHGCGPDGCPPPDGGDGGSSPDTVATIGGTAAYGFNAQNYVEYWDTGSNTLRAQGYYSTPSAGRCRYNQITADGTSIIVEGPDTTTIPDEGTISTADGSTTGHMSVSQGTFTVQSPTSSATGTANSTNNSITVAASTSSPAPSSGSATHSGSPGAYSLHCIGAHMKGDMQIIALLAAAGAVVNSYCQQYPGPPCQAFTLLVGVLVGQQIDAIKAEFAATGCPPW